MQRTLCVLILALAESAAHAESRPLVISTLPFDEPANQEAVFGLLNEQLGLMLNRTVRFEAGNDYGTVIERLSRGEVDVALVGAVAYVKSRKASGAQAILRTVRNRKAWYEGVVVVRTGSPVKTLANLQGRSIAFVDAQSTAGYRFPRLLLERQGFQLGQGVTTIFAGGHHKVVMMVAAGEVDAGACFDGAQESLDDPKSLTVIARTDPIPSDPIVVRSGMGRTLRRQLRSSLIALATTAKAKPFFAFSGIDGFVPAFDSDYDDVAALVAEQDRR